MATRIRNDNWKDDEELKRDLEKYVKQNLKRKEVLDFVSSKYPMYVWSLRTLCRRLSHFNIKYTNYEIELDNLRQAVAEEMQGPGKLLGYRALHKKIREIHDLNVPRDVVYAMMAEVTDESYTDVELPLKPLLFHVLISRPYVVCPRAAP